MAPQQWPESWQDCLHINLPQLNTWYHSIFLKQYAKTIFQLLIASESPLDISLIGQI